MTINNHGDIILYPIKPKKPVKTAKKAKIHILQESGTTGNRHEVVAKKGFIYHWESKGIEYLHSDNDFEIRHVGGDSEHGIQLVEAGIKEVRHEMEHDPWSNELRRVID